LKPLGDHPHSRFPLISVPFAGMSVMFLISLIGTGLLLMFFETRGMRTTLALSFKGDVKRETRWLAHYGQSACTIVAAVLAWQLDPREIKAVEAIIVATFATSPIAVILKRLLSRVRPGREHAGKFLGPSRKHANYKESFPSIHSAARCSRGMWARRSRPVQILIRSEMARRL